MELQNLIDNRGGVEALIDEFEALQPYTLDNYQRESATEIVEEQRGILTAYPTGAGKTIIAEFCIWLAHKLGKRAIFTNPLKALSTEKLDEWDEKYPDWTVIRDTSDDRHKRSEKYYEGYTVLVTTNERLESILRKKKWINIIFPNVMFAIYDEVHLLGSKGRGSSVEATMIAIKLMVAKKMIPEVKFVGLSATLPNSQPFGDWLGVPVYVLPPEMRPVPLEHHFDLDPTWETTAKRRTEDKMYQVYDLIRQYPKDNFLIFVSSRQRCTEIAWNVANGNRVMPRPAWKYRGDQGSLLDDVVDRKVAWHNAGLDEYQRKHVESSFKAGKIRVLVATPTLAQGVNLPARRVIMFDLSRWKPLLSKHVFLEHYEIQQQAGRAGRRGFDNKGDTYYLGQQHEIAEAQKSVEEPYIMESVLHEKLDEKILALYVSDVAQSTEDVINIINDSFGAKQGLVTQEMTEKNLEFLDKNGFTKLYANGITYPSKIGRAISARYLSPRSVIDVRSSFNKLIDLHKSFSSTNGFQMRDLLVHSLQVPEILEGIRYDEDMDEALVQGVIHHFYEKDQHNFKRIELYHMTDEGYTVVQDDTMALYKLIGVAYGTYFKNQGIKHYTTGSENEARYLIQQWIENAQMIAGFYPNMKIISKREFKQVLNSVKNGKPLALVEDLMATGDEGDLDSLFDNMLNNQ